MNAKKVSSGEANGSVEARAGSRVSRPPDRPTSLDTGTFRRTMGLLATGVTVITTRLNGSIHGMTASAVTSVSLEPLLVLVAIDRRHRMCNIIQEAGEFAINILTAYQQEIARHFAGAHTAAQPVTLQFESDPDSGTPCIHDSLASICCRVDRVLDGGDHIIVLGLVVRFHAAGPTRPPLLYFSDQDRSLCNLNASGSPEDWNPGAVGLSRKPGLAGV